MDLSKAEIRQILEEYFKLDNRSERTNFDPVDDFARLCVAAYQSSDAPKRPGDVVVESPVFPPGTAGGLALIYFVGDYLHAINPGLSADNWARIYHAILMARHGRGTLLRFRKRPALGAQVDARLPFMTPKKLQALHPHLCRSRIYKILQDARKKK